MPTYVVPSFNLQCNVWTYPAVIGPYPPVGGVGAARLVDQVCALVYGRRVNAGASYQGAAFGFPSAGTCLLLPALADLRGPQDTVGPDLVECPAGSGRYYSVVYCDDIGKGWPNEHRTGLLMAIPHSWTAPYP